MGPLLAVAHNNNISVFDRLAGKYITLKGHKKDVTSLSFNITGTTIASGSDDKTVRLWSVSAGVCLATLKGHTGGVKSVGFTGYGKQIISVGFDNTFRFWNAFKAFDGVQKIASEPVSINSSFRPSDFLNSVAFSLEGRRDVRNQWAAMGGQDGRIYLWSLLSKGAPQFLEGHTQEVTSVAFSPDGQKIASASMDGTVRLWNITKMKSLRTLSGHIGNILSLAFDQSGREIYAGSSEQKIFYWDTTTGQLLDTIEGYTAPVTNLAFNPRKQQLASAGCDQTIRFWETIPKSLINAKDAEKVNGIAFTENGRVMVTKSEDGTIKLWAVGAGKWNVGMGRLLQIFDSIDEIGQKQENSLLPIDGTEIKGLVETMDNGTTFSRDKFLGGNVQEKGVEVFNRSGTYRGYVRGVSRGVKHILFNPNVVQGRFLATAGDTIQYWQLDETGKKACLIWSTSQASLDATDADLSDVVGLSEENRKLLEQRGAREKVEEDAKSLTSIPPLDLIPEDRMEIYGTGDYRVFLDTVDSHVSDLTKWDEKGGTVLHRICWNKTLKDDESASLTTYVIQREAGVSVTHKVSGRRPLHLAAMNNKVKLIEVLLSHGAAVDERNFHGETPLMLAASFSGNEQAIRFLIGRGADMNAVSYKDVTTSPGGSMTALHWAASQCPSNIAILKEAGANSKCLSDEGWGTSEFSANNPQYREAPLHALIIDDSIPEEKKISRVRDLLLDDSSNEEVLLKSFQQATTRKQIRIMSLFEAKISQEKRLSIVKESLENLSRRLKEVTKELGKYEYEKEKKLDALKVISLLKGDVDLTEWPKKKREFYASGEDKKLDEKIQSTQIFITGIKSEIASLSAYINTKKSSKICVGSGILRLRQRP